MQLKVGKSLFAKPEIRSMQMNQKSTLIMPELEPDTITAVVEDKSTVVQPLAASSMLLAAGGIITAAKLADRAVDQYRYGEKITVDAEGITTMMNVENIRRVAAYVYQIDGISDIGLLMNCVYYGGIYNGITFAALIDEIINHIFAYTIDAELQNMAMYGWLPKSTRRDALHSALFAAGAVVLKTDTGEVKITAQAQQTPYTPDDIYLTGTVQDIPPATKVTVVEHAYFAMPSDENVTLFDGEVAAENITTPNGKTANGVIVEFAEPIHDLAIENGTIIESGANYAVIGQSPATRLTGKRYTHTQRTLQQTISDNISPNEYTADSCGLVNLMNSENVLARLVSYYGATKQYQIEFVYKGQKPGDAVTFTNPVGDPATGYIESLDIVSSHTDKASATVTEGYTATAAGNYYTHASVFTSNGTFTVPAECKGKIKIVLVSGGQGGHAGKNGENGIGATASGKGGDAGAGGEGARIYVATLSVKQGQTFTFVIGKGGKGAVSGAEPQDGEDTTFGAYTSANGRIAENGYSLLLLDEIVGLSGTSGIRGGNGGTDGSGEDVTYNGVTYKGGIRPEGRYQPEYDMTAPSGNGGGAAVGNNGGDGKTGHITTESVSGEMQMYIYGGDGGDGASAVQREAAAGIGNGGPGGHGGGGGGRGAEGSSALGNGDGGKGGIGGTGGDGSPGGLIVYY